jgi:hypothetical protein
VAIIRELTDSKRIAIKWEFTVELKFPQYAKRFKSGKDEWIKYSVVGWNGGFYRYNLEL